MIQHVPQSRHAVPYLSWDVGLEQAMQPSIAPGVQGLLCIHLGSEGLIGFNQVF